MDVDGMERQILESLEELIKGFRQCSDAHREAMAEFKNSFMWSEIPEDVRGVIDRGLDMSATSFENFSTVMKLAKVHFQKNMELIRKMNEFFTEQNAELLRKINSLG